MKKRRIATALLLLLLAGILGGCGKQGSKTQEGESAASTETSGSVSGSSDTLTVVTNPGVHEDVLNKAAQILSGKGLAISGMSPDGRLVETVEIKEHPFFIGVQFHPEFKSRPNKPHPIFKGFVEAASRRKADVIST